MQGNQQLQSTATAHLPSHLQAETAEAAGAEAAAREEGRKARDAILEEGLTHCVVRTKPLGSDRHHRRYWWLAGEKKKNQSS